MRGTMLKAAGGMFVAVLVLAQLMTGTGASAGEELGRGHILVGGPWISFRSAAVLTNADAPDGFFLQLTSDSWGKRISANVVRNGSGAPYALSVNFHGSTRGTFGRNWLGGCTGVAVDQDLNADTTADVNGCLIPAGATTVEVTAYWGADLDVVVDLD